MSINKIADRTLYLIGARAAGKTTIGEKLSQTLGSGFVDTDIHISRARQATPAEIIAREGWAAFRQLEGEFLRKVTAPGVVVATGGGVILAESNRVFMRSGGLVFYLSAPAEVLAARLAADPQAASRPSLTGRPVVEEVAQILAERDALYREAAHHLIDASAPPDEVLAAILARLAEDARPSDHSSRITQQAMSPYKPVTKTAANRQTGGRRRCRR